jgi:hypothetical protein
MALPKKQLEPSMKDYASDIIEIKGNIENIQRHMAEGKTERKEQTDTLKDIKNTLVGNSLNGNKGIVFLLNHIDERVKELERTNLERIQTENNIKWLGGFVFMSIFSLMIWIITHLKNS